MTRVTAPVIGRCDPLAAEAEAVAWLGGRSVHLNEPGPLLVVGVLLSHLQGDAAGVTLGTLALVWVWLH